MIQQKTLTGTGVSDPIMLNVFGWPFISIQADVTTTATNTSFDVQQTLQDVQTLGVAGVTWLTANGTNTATLSGMAGNFADCLISLPRAIRISQTSSTGVIQLTAIQPGLAGV